MKASHLYALLEGDYSRISDQLRESESYAVNNMMKGILRSAYAEDFLAVPLNHDDRVQLVRLVQLYMIGVRVFGRLDDRVMLILPTVAYQRGISLLLREASKHLFLGAGSMTAAAAASAYRAHADRQSPFMTYDVMIYSDCQEVTKKNSYDFAKACGMVSHSDGLILLATSVRALDFEDKHTTPLTVRTSLGVAPLKVLHA